LNTNRSIIYLEEFANAAKLPWAISVAPCVCDSAAILVISKGAHPP
jgi:hypothetical protein